MIPSGLHWTKWQNCSNATSQRFQDISRTYSKAESYDKTQYLQKMQLLLRMVKLTRSFINLDMIISVGYRDKALEKMLSNPDIRKQASHFVCWKQEACWLLSFWTLFLTRFKIILAHSAQRANPIFRNVFKRRTRRNARFRITNFWVVNPLAYCTNILLHRLMVLNVYVSFTSASILHFYRIRHPKKNRFYFFNRSINSAMPSEALFIRCVTLTLPDTFTGLGSIK